MNIIREVTAMEKKEVPVALDDDLLENVSGGFGKPVFPEQSVIIPRIEALGDDHAPPAIRLQ